ncbi:MAG: uracil phosphoribosyltransferase [Planctomycetota bacterium]|nr:uracil phosphoribosyltransferase [Planctomycetota bacterium]
MGRIFLAAKVVDHPLVKHHLTELRCTDTPSSTFRRLIHRLSTLLAYEATKNLTTADRIVQTPICQTTGQKLDQRIALVPILRAGLGMVDPVLDLIPDAEVWHLGLYRDETTAKPVEYYNKLPSDHVDDLGLILDPMLATGGSASSACAALTKWGIPNIKLLSIIAAPEGIDVVNRDFPDVELFVCSIDERLNDQKFIIPGLGDAGDRIFHT